MNTQRQVVLVERYQCAIGSSQVSGPYGFICLAEPGEDAYELMGRVREEMRLERIVVMNLGNLPAYPLAWQQFLQRTVIATVQKEGQE